MKLLLLLLLLLALIVNGSSFLLKTIPSSSLRSKIAISHSNNLRINSILKMSNEEYVDEEGDSINNSGIIL